MNLQNASLLYNQDESVRCPIFLMAMWGKRLFYWLRCYCVGVPLLFLTPFTLANPEENKVPIPCWVNRESFGKIMRRSCFELGTFSTGGRCSNHSAISFPYIIGNPAGFTFIKSHKVCCFIMDHSIEIIKGRCQDD